MLGFSSVVKRSFFYAIGLGFLGVASSPAWAQSIIVDDFSTDQMLIFAIGNGATAEDTATDAGILGTERDIQITQTGGDGQVSSEVSSGLFRFAGDTATSGNASIVWDGTDGDATTLDPVGLGGVDLTNGGTLSALQLTISGANISHSVSIEVFTDGANSSVASLLTQSDPLITADFVLVFSDFAVNMGTGADFSNVGAIALTVNDGNFAELVTTIDQLSAVPTLSATLVDDPLLLVDNDFDNVLSAGDTVLYGVNIRDVFDESSSGSTDVVFTSGTDPQSSLVVGSVTTSQGTVTTGNTFGDTTIAVDVGTIVNGGGTTITFAAVLNDPVLGNTSIATQGTVTATELPGGTLTDDPDDPTGQQDATITPISTNSVSGAVYNDLNGNGTRDTGEPGINGVTIDLFLDRDFDPSPGPFDLLLSTQTTAGTGPDEGTYVFAGLGTSRFNVDITDAANVLDGFVLTQGADPAELSFGVGSPPATLNLGYQQQDASIGDFVWNDLDGDGIQDGGEPGIDGVTLDLYNDVNGDGVLNGGDMLLTTQTTAGGGAYDFTSLGAGNYLVDVTDIGNILAGLSLTGGTDPAAVALAAGQDFNDADFGYQATGTIGDFVWNDLDADGVQDAGEPGIDGVTLDLIDDANGNGVIDGGEAVVGTATTAGGGAYDFTGIGPDDYIVDVTDTGNVLNGFVLTGGTTPLAVSLAASQDFNDADFGYQQQNASAGDFIFNDLNGDGIQDGGEPGIDGVTVDLYNDVNGNLAIDGGDILVGTETTAGGGSYDFTGLPAGDYLIDVTDTGNVLVGFVETGTSSPVNTNLSPGEDFNDADFGYQQQDATIGDFVWNDLNGDGIQDAGEPGIDGVTLDLIDDANGNGTIDGGEAVLDTQTTAGGGAYDFTDLPLGDYIVTVTDTANVLDGFVLTGGTEPLAVTLVAGQDFNDADFGYRPNGSIGDFVWNDLNGDGVQDAGEPGLDGVTIDLIDDANGNGVIDGGEAVLETQTTAGGGAYDFEDLIPTDYLVNVTDTANVLDGFVLTGGTNPLAVTLTAGQDFNDADFGYQQQDASIGDFVWNDLNGDGVQDAGEPGIDGVTLDLIDDANGNGSIDAGEAVLDTQTTAGGGAYDFTDLPTGDYLVNVTDTTNQLDGFVQTGGVNPITVSLAVSQDFNDADFGYQQQDASISAVLFLDFNNNDILDGNDFGLDNITIDLLLDSDGSGTVTGADTLVGAATTANGGQYAFTNLPMGDYLVVITDQNGELAGLILDPDINPLVINLVAGATVTTAANFAFGIQATAVPVNSAVALILLSLLLISLGLIVIRRRGTSLG